jgi:hypothetical protein
MKSALSFSAGVAMVALILSACNRLFASQQTPVATVESTPSILQTWTGIYSDTDRTDWSDALSPDGQWLIPDYAALPGMPMQIIFTDIPTRFIQLAVNPEIDQGTKEITTWSPDSTAIAVLSAKRAGKCQLDRLIIYHIVDQSYLERSVFHLPEDHTACEFHLSSWAPDSSRLLIQDSETIYILDRQAQLLHQIPIEIPIQIPGTRFDAIWTTCGILVKVDYDDRAPYELWLINPDNPDDRESLMRSDDAFYIVGMDPAGQRVLLNAYIDNAGARLRVFDIASRQVMREILQQGSLWGESSSSIPLGWIGFTMNVPNIDSPLHFFVFDWANLELRDYTSELQKSDDVSLVGWQTRVNGFLLLYDRRTKTPYFGVLHP